MKKKFLLTVVGARPQFIKAAMISKIIKTYKNLNETIIHTGQHYDENMSKIFFKKLKIKKAKYNLNVNNLSHNLMLSEILLKLDNIYEKEKPDGVIVYGDTNSSLGAALCAKKRNIPLFHIESGVRNYDENMPEESNRYLIDRISDINFCATKLNVKNLIKEGFNLDTINSKIVKSGDVMYDLFKIFKNNQTKKIISQKKDYILSTIHRESNVERENCLKNIIMALNEINKSIPVILILHPRTKKKIFSRNIICDFKVIDPIGYKEMMSYLLSCKYVITDSGGLVREAYFAKKKSLFILDNPVWPEIISQKFCINISPNKKKILNSFKKLLRYKGVYKKSLFGNGKASSAIVKKIINFLN